VHGDESSYLISDGHEKVTCIFGMVWALIVDNDSLYLFLLWFDQSYTIVSNLLQSKTTGNIKVRILPEIFDCSIQVDLFKTLSILLW